MNFPDRYAAIDIGSNGMRLLIAKVVELNGVTSVQKLSLVRVPIRLGEDVFNEGVISEEKKEKFIKTIKAYKLLMDIYQVKDFRAVATSAMREAKNGNEIANLIKKETDIDISLIDGKMEADLIFSTIYTQNINKSDSYLFIDVGGGSTEITIFNKGKRVESKSFKIGTVRLLQGKVEEENWKELDEWLNNVVNSDKDFKAIGTGGNINRYFKLSRNNHLEPVKLDVLNELYSDLNSLTKEERAEKYRLRYDRADVIVPAGKIYLTILERCGINEIIVPKIGLSDGIVYYLYKRDNY
jgi:exopolyphosphatase / guanosine-5'-triphosphate,3'-diphosphate pyrophosphatase